VSRHRFFRGFSFGLLELLLRAGPGDRHSHSGSSAAQVSGVGEA